MIFALPLTGSIIQVKKFGGGEDDDPFFVSSSRWTVMNHRPFEGPLVGESVVAPSGWKRNATYS